MTKKIGFWRWLYNKMHEVPEVIINPIFQIISSLLIICFATVITLVSFYIGIIIIVICLLMALHGFYREEANDW